MLPLLLTFKLVLLGTNGTNPFWPFTVSANTPWDMYVSPIVILSTLKPNIRACIIKPLFLCPNTIKPLWMVKPILLANSLDSRKLWAKKLQEPLCSFEEKISLQSLRHTLTLSTDQKWAGNKDKVNMVKPKSKELTEPVMAREFRALPFIDEQMRSEMKKLFYTAQERVRTGN